MKKLLQIEWIKLWPYKAFRILFIVYFLLLGLSLLIGRSLNNGEGEELNKLFKILSVPNIWNYYLFVAVLLNIVLGIIVIFVISNEYSFKTMRQNLIDGLNRNQLFVSKLLLISILTFLSTLVVYISGLIAGKVYNPDATFSDLLERNVLIGGYAIACFGTLSMASLFAIILKRSGLATIVFILFIFPLDVILNQGLLKGCCNDYLPVSVLFKGIIEWPGNMIRSFGEEAQTALAWLPVTMGLVYIGLFNFLSWFIIRRRDL
ncbi:MAG: ABC transporter permease [Chitinophagales bacterium]|nr:ABC transporter permease [Chitinophagales bacterium]MCB9022209.1 ABC transporter permease [Chitinophagales bacterium]HPE98026.1 ABC transporter permease [Chitinophagales bacterium]HRX24187.1 ABC transporter permease [Chitinophagales bacterium]